VSTDTSGKVTAARLRRDALIFLGSWAKVLFGGGYVCGRRRSHTGLGLAVPGRSAAS
jgi:hypothetical protein